MNSEIYFLLGLMVAIFIVIVVRKIKANDCEFDERQVLIRGKAYKIGFMTMLLLAAAFVFACTVNEDLVAYGHLWNVVSMFLGLTAFAVYSILNDAFLTLKQSAGKYFALCIVVTACNCLWLPDVLRGKTTIAELLTSYEGLNVVCALTFVIIGSTLIVKIFIDRKEVE